MIDTNEIRNKLNDGKISYNVGVNMLCDEIDRLRGEQQTPPLDDESVLTSMCMTYRHDFGLLSEKDRGPIINMIRPIYEHHVKPLLRSKTAVTPQGETVKVKVQVVVHPDGRWWAGSDFREEKRISRNYGEAQYWLTATLPVPAEVCVVAKVEGE